MAPMGRLHFAGAIIVTLIAFFYFRNSAMALKGEGQIFWGLAIIAFVWMFIFAIKRLADLRMKGLWSLCLMLPIINIAFVIYLMFKRSRLDPQ
jgi:uncharacterized membrane protein YhaH (DUF805 family)